MDALDETGRLSVEVSVTELWRHPVKSLQGQSVASVKVVSDGVEHDRAWGIRDLRTGRVLTARRAPDLLYATAALEGGAPIVTLPDGTRTVGLGPDTDSALSAWLDRPVSLVASNAVPPARAEYFADATDDDSAPIEWTMPPGRFVDAMPILLLTSASLLAGTALHPDGEWKVRRFRPNVVVAVAGDQFLEDTWCHRPVRIGEVELLPRERCIRCTMVTRPQPGLARDLDIYKVLARYHGGTLGVWSEVTRPGVVNVGDPVAIG